MNCGHTYLCPQESYAGVTFRSLACVIVCGLAVLVFGPISLFGWLIHQVKIRLSTRAAKVVNTVALVLLCGVAHGATVNLAWDASATDGCEYRVYVQSGSSIARVECGTNLAVGIEDIAPGFYSFWATAILCGIESDPSNVTTVEVPAPPQGMRTVAVDFAAVITNWSEVGFIRVRLP